MLHLRCYLKCCSLYKSSVEEQIYCALKGTGSAMTYKSKDYRYAHLSLLTRRVSNSSDSSVSKSGCEKTLVYVFVPSTDRHATGLCSFVISNVILIRYEVMYQLLEKSRVCKVGRCEEVGKEKKTRQGPLLIYITSTSILLYESCQDRHFLASILEKYSLFGARTYYKSDTYESA